MIELELPAEKILDASQGESRRAAIARRTERRGDRQRVENLTSKRDARLDDCKSPAAFRTVALKIERDWD